MEENKTQGEEVEAEKVVSEEQQNSSSSENAEQSDAEKNKGMAIVSYFIFFLPLLTDAKDSPFAKFHANQSLVLFLFMIIVNFLGAFIPLLGWFLIWPIGLVMGMVFFILGIINASNEEMKKLPLIGGINIIT